MELWVGTIIQTVISGLIIWAMRSIVGKSSDLAKTAQEAEKRFVQKEFSDITIRMVALEQKQERLLDEVHQVREKIAVLIQKNEDLTTRVFMLTDAMEKAKIVAGAHGRVIRKP